MLRQALGLQVGGHSGNVVGVGPRQVRQGLVARLGVGGGALEAVEDKAFDLHPARQQRALELGGGNLPGSVLVTVQLDGRPRRGVLQHRPRSGRSRASHHQRLFTPRGERQAVREALDDYQPLRVRRGITHDGATTAGRSECSLGYLRAVVHARAALRVQRYQLDGVHVGDARPCGDPRRGRREQRH